MKKLSQDLEATEQLCSSMQQGYQEYCPDIQRQRREVKQLQTRYANVSNQLKERWESDRKQLSPVTSVYVESQTTVGFASTCITERTVPALKHIWDDFNVCLKVK